MGVLGLLLNCLVILGVRSNRKLSTSINILLLWLCGASILEASLGVIVKCLVIGELVILTVILTVKCLIIGEPVSFTVGGDAETMSTCQPGCRAIAIFCHFWTLLAIIGPLLAIIDHYWLPGGRAIAKILSLRQSDQSDQSNQIFQFY